MRSSASNTTFNIIDNTFINNSATNYAGALYSTGIKPNLTNNTFMGNTALNRPSNIGTQITQLVSFTSSTSNSSEVSSIKSIQNVASG